MSEEIKAALETGLKSVNDKLNSAIEKYEGQIKENGKVSQEAKDAVKALSDEYVKMESNIREIAQKMTDSPKGKPESKSAGEQFIDSAEFKSLVSGSSNKVRVETKNTVVSDATANVAPQYKPGISPGPFVPLTVRNVLPSAVTNSPLVIGIREKLTAGWTNNAAETAQAAAKPQSMIAFEQYNVPIQTIAHYVKVSNQLLQDAPAVVSYIDTRLRYGLDNRVDGQLLNGDGTGANLSGILLAANHTAFTPTTGANLAESINKAKYQLWAAGYVVDAAFVNPADWGAMETLKATGSGEYLWGAPGLALGMNPFGVRVVISPFVPAGQFVIGAFQQHTAVWNRVGVVVEMGYENDDFTKNLVTLRAECRVGLEVNRPSAILAGAFTA